MKPLPESKSITGSLMQCCPSDHLNLQWTRKQIYPEKIACCPCPNIAKRPSTKTCSTVKGDFFLTEFHLPATAAPLTLAELCRCDTGSASTRRCKSVLSCFAPRLSVSGGCHSSAGVALWQTRREKISAMQIIG